LFSVAARWQTPYGDTTVGMTVLASRGLFQNDWWRWVGMAVLFGYTVLFNILVLLAQTYLGRELPPSEPEQAQIYIRHEHSPSEPKTVQTYSGHECSPSEPK